MLSLVLAFCASLALSNRFVYSPSFLLIEVSEYRNGDLDLYEVSLFTPLILFKADWFTTSTLSMGISRRTGVTTLVFIAKSTSLRYASKL